MAFSTALKLLPLALLLACEHQPATRTVPTVAAPPTAAPAPVTHKAAPDSAGTTFTWQDEVCLNTGTFPAGAYTQRQLRDTYRLASGILLNTRTVAFNFSDYNDTYFKLAAASLEHEHDSLAAMLHGLQVVPNPYWRKMKQLRELQLAEEYTFRKTQLEGYFHPESWRRNRYYAHCTAYADALASTDTAVVLQAWRRLTDEEKRNNGYPEALEREFVRVSARPEAMQYAKMKLMTFGWGNCANSLSKYNRLDEKGEPVDKFGQLFKHISQTNCVETD
ncbi:MAG: hypothetical protein ACRYFZ_24275 [Janthinobacterium lividum]